MVHPAQACGVGLMSACCGSLSGKLEFREIRVAPKLGGSFASWKQHSFWSLRRGSQAIYLLCDLRELLGLRELRVLFLKIEQYPAMVLQVHLGWSV